MRNAIVLVCVLFLSQTPLLATYKILISSHLTQQKASLAKDKIEHSLQKNNYYQIHQNNEGYQLYTYPLEKYFVVTIEPIQSEKVLNTLLHIARKYNENAFASYSIQQYEVPVAQKISKESLPLSSSQLKEDKTVPIERTPTINTSKYLRNKPETIKEHEISYLYTAIAILALITLMLIIWLLQLKKRLAITQPQYESRSTEIPTLISSQAESQLLVDIHSHLIPGIDDGVKNMEESIALVKRFHNLGYKKIITTPHIMSHRYSNNSQTLQNGLELLQERIAEEHIDIQIEIASEYYLDDHLMNLIAQFDVLTFGANYLLFEMSYINHPVNLEAMIEVMIEAGYTPVLAHPERYVYMSKNFSKYLKLKELGVLFQLNINSIAGYYSEEVKQLAHRLVEAGIIDFIGSDVHHMRHMQSIEKVIQTQEFRNIFQKNTILNNTL